MAPSDELLQRALALPPLRDLVRAVDGGPIYLAGGAVRDLLSGRVPLDLDLVLDGPVAPLAERLGGIATTHDRFETATLALESGVRVDIARSRRERYQEPGALPEIAPAPIEQDLLRRDFTVYAMALALSGPDLGRLLTAPHALDDLRTRRLRVLHDQSFSDDPTRLLRLARYRARLGFEVEPHTLALVAAHADRGLATISGARIGQELRLVVREDDPVAGLAALDELGIDRAIDPCFTIGQPEAGGIEVMRQALALLPADGRRDLLTLAAALRRCESDHLSSLLQRLAFTAADRDVIRATATSAQPLAGALRGLKLPSRIAAVIGSATAEAVALAGGLGAEPQARAWLEQLRHLTLDIDGTDLRAAGVPEGPALGAGLAAARAALLDGDAPDRAEQLAVAVRAAEALGPGGDRA